MIDSAEHTALPVPIMIRYYGGLRRGELLALKASDIEVDPEWTEGGLWIRRSISEFDGKHIPADVVARYGDSIVAIPNSTRLLRIKQTKTKRVRFVPLPADILDRLREHIADQAKIRESLTGAQLDHHGWLFARPDGSGELWAPSAFTSCYRHFLRRRGLKPARFHGLRHAYGSNLINDGNNLKTVSSLMGHARTSTTADVYAHLLERPGREVAERIQARINRTKATLRTEKVN
jgi:integrase